MIDSINGGKQTVLSGDLFCICGITFGSKVMEPPRRVLTVCNAVKPFTAHRRPKSSVFKVKTQKKVSGLYNSGFLGLPVVSITAGRLSKGLINTGGKKTVTHCLPNTHLHTHTHTEQLTHSSPLPSTPPSFLSRSLNESFLVSELMER